jgi:hypothetical protein
VERLENPPPALIPINGRKAQSREAAPPTPGLKFSTPEGISKTGDKARENSCSAYKAQKGVKHTINAMGR